MGKFLGILLIALGVLIGYGLRTPPVTAQSAAFPFASGASVRLTVHDFPSGARSIDCTVSAVHNEFIGCAGDDGLRQRAPRFVNLRYVQEITPAQGR